MADNDIERESTAHGSGDASIKNCKEPEIRRLSVTPLLRQYSPSPLSSIGDMDLVELSLIDVLTQAAVDVLGSIPAQRCVVYIYDKDANLLKPQVVVDCHDTGLEEAAVQVKTEEMDTSSLVSFPPVVGMISSCFLQRRCLRMQEPNPHRSFHREYDVPKDMLVDSILCAPVILYHRATAVIQLLNRLDTARERNSFAEDERAATPHDVKHESTSEVRLRRLKTVKTVLTGFSSKDEQKLLHFTTHIAQTIETNAKKVATIRSHAKIREDKAKQALELLNALNGKAVAHVNSTDMLLSTGDGGSTYMRRATITRLSSQRSEMNDMLRTLVVIMRVQALFRGRRVRRAEKFAEELEKFRRQRERMKTLLVMQRVVSGPDPPKSKVREGSPTGKVRKPASRSKKQDTSKEPLKAPPSPKPPSTPSTPRPPPQPEAPSPRPQTQLTRIQKRRMSAVKIQKVFRRHRQRRKAIEPPSPAKPVAVSKEVVSAVKVQSFIRGNLVRKRLRRSLLSVKGPRIVCLRVASASEPVSNQTSHDNAQLRSQTCVYAMPERPGKAPPAQRRISYNQDQLDNELRPQKTPGIALASRRLVALYKGDVTRLHKSPFCRSRPRWDRLVPSVVWETTENPGLTPGVEFVKQHRLEKRKEDSPRGASITTDTNQKASIRLPVLTSQPQPASSLLCCLLPVSNGLIAAQTNRKVVRTKRRHSPE
ncbi:hypothetical protein P3T76_004375 [Phytophthora citrophthora]|uniref:GAF domain-containing protein n=1 Tax=Phytophthora citrophthora TaxID=4793 RepID=A0AAD9GUQ2_9STRA|nr:hypothetical protein P3T76_004375 [Phytophthora citrophthora]